MIPFKFEKTANVSTSSGTFNAPGSSNMPGAGYGAASVPGMSVHCLTCGKKLKRGASRCECGADVSNVVSAENQKASPADGLQDQDTGGPAAVAQEQTEKHSSAVPAGSLLQNLTGGAALVGSGILGAKLWPSAKRIGKQVQADQVAQLVEVGRLPPEEMEKVQHQIEKWARKGGNPILSLREARKRLQKASGKIRASMVLRSK